jgi:hypothetical protein
LIDQIFRLHMTEQSRNPVRSVPNWSREAAGRAGQSLLVLKSSGSRAQIGVFSAKGAPSYLQPGAPPQGTNADKERSAESAIHSDVLKIDHSESRFQRSFVTRFQPPEAIAQAGITPRLWR